MRFLDDDTIADMTAMSKPWVRVQRYKRRHGLPHVFTVEPIYIGSAVRYAEDAVLAWMEALKSQKKD